MNHPVNNRLVDEQSGDEQSGDEQSGDYPSGDEFFEYHIMIDIEYCLIEKLQNSYNDCNSKEKKRTTTKTTTT